MINPFEMMKNLKEVQNSMEKMKEEMKKISVTGSAGGNMVQVTLNGQFEVTAIKIDPIAVDPRDVNMLQDIIVAAHHDAMEKVQEQLKARSSEMLGGMDLQQHLHFHL